MRPAESTVSESNFKYLYQQTARSLQAYLLRLGRDRALADDILQETYLRFLTARLPEMDESRKKSYLFKIASNLLADHYRRQKREKPDQDLVVAAPSPDPPTDPLTRIDLHGLLDELSLPQRQLLWLCHVEGYTHAQVAEILGVRSKSVRVLLYRARSKFAALIRNSGWMTKEKT